MKHDIEAFFYKNFVKPFLFMMDPEPVHNFFMWFGHLLGANPLTQKLTALAFKYENQKLQKELLGIKFKNPVGLSAGYDYNGLLARIPQNIGFGFATIGTVTNKPYKGNSKPLFARLKKSKSLLVNKGFKNDGADIIFDRINDPALKDVTFGVSIGNSNIPEIDTVAKAITDYIDCFTKMNKNPYLKYFELNISCPNIGLEGSFLNPLNFGLLLDEVNKLHIERPVFIKMPNEISEEDSDKLVEIGLAHGVKGYIFSNLVKRRDNPAFVKEEIDKVAAFKGNFSGKPTQENSNKLIKHSREKYGNNIVIIGTGGIFTPKDAINKIKLGADLVQLITGMVFEGPQLIGQITKEIAKQNV